MKTNCDIHFESEHKVYIEAEQVGVLQEDDGCVSMFRATRSYALYASDLRSIADKLDELNGLDKADSPKWIGWEGEDGSKGPVPNNCEVEVLFRGGTNDQGPAGLYEWSTLGDNVDIVAYRVIDESNDS